MSSDRIDPDDRLLATAQRALGIVERHGGIGGHKNDRVARTMDVALVELMIENVRAGFVSRPEYLRQPPHLPDTEKEMRVLSLSIVPKDQTLRADMFEWAQINRRIGGQAALTLRNAVLATRFADVALNAGDENDVEIHAWKLEIEHHLTSTYEIDLGTAPDGLAELDQWCAEVMAKFNPVPEWLRDTRPQAQTSGTVFTPKPKIPPAVKELYKTTSRRTSRSDDDEE